MSFFLFFLFFFIPSFWLKKDGSLFLFSPLLFLLPLLIASYSHSLPLFFSLLFFILIISFFHFHTQPSVITTFQSQPFHTTHLHFLFLLFFCFLSCSQTINVYRCLFEIQNRFSFCRVCKMQREVAKKNWNKRKWWRKTKKTIKKKVLKNNKQKKIYREKARDTNGVWQYLWFWKKKKKRSLIAMRIRAVFKMYRDGNRTYRDRNENWMTQYFFAKFIPWHSTYFSEFSISRSTFKTSLLT